MDLPEPDRTVLQASPLAVVVCQVRYDQKPSVSQGKSALAIHDDLGGARGPYPKLEPVNFITAQLQMGIPGIPTSPAVQVPARGWRMTSEDGSWIVSVMPDHFSIETTAYTEWGKDFRERLTELAGLLARHVEPSIEERLGLRYVDRITHVGGNGLDWPMYITPELLGPLQHPVLGPAISSAQQQLDLEVDDVVRCTLRHGLFHDPESRGEASYLLDFDVYRQHPQRFDPAAIVEAADRMNSVSLSLFQLSITDQLLDLYRKGEVP
jgi:uncharacterized protein (TIGR04255 family)